VAPEFRAGARVVYIGQEGDEMSLGYVVSVHGDGKGGPPFYKSYLEGLVEKQVEGQRLSLLLLKRSRCPYFRSSAIPLFFQGISSQERKTGKEGIPKADVWNGKYRPSVALVKQET
jgi:hypothetical protein